LNKTRLLGAVCACLSVISFNAVAAVVSQGFLTSNDDGSSNIITDSLNNVEYLRFNVLADLTYAQTIAVLDTQDGGGWSIASPTDAVKFTEALIGTTACTHDGLSVVLSPCGSLTAWYDGKLGNDHGSTYDFAWFLDSGGQADYVRIKSTGEVIIDDYNLADADEHAVGGIYDYVAVTWLVARPVVVPVPPAVWLFGSGLLGLIGVARRKKAA